MLKEVSDFQFKRLYNVYMIMECTLADGKDIINIYKYEIEGRC